MTTAPTGVFVLTGTQRGRASPATITLPFAVDPTPRTGETVAATSPVPGGNIANPASARAAHENSSIPAAAAAELTSPVTRHHGPSRAQTLINLLRARVARRIAARARLDAPA